MTDLYGVPELVGKSYINRILAMSAIWPVFKVIWSRRQRCKCCEWPCGGGFNV
jgi:hypothetical protein